MNPRIRELAEQALEQVCSKRTQSDGQIERAWHPDHFNQVFAELIVKECAKVLTQHGAYFSGNGEPYHYAASLIEEHFGVE